MARRATIIGQAEDISGEAWDVRESRPTPHGFAVLLGWPHSTQRGQGGGGVRVILTPNLADYLAAHCHHPVGIDLPLSRNAVKRLRKMLDLDWTLDNEQWWHDHKADLLASTLADFCERHGKSLGAASQWRAVFGGKRYSHSK
ncbi:hypothetical protein [Salidesulfovibrio brasiliensis]|uniref:hypothetical protein n=1 Tax=Salidesulfovibrio brasiliensis TaxID=221711 RepID=UPI0006D154A7|nr:hypothetical protein [Salidesulfovibrio brasiliensis]